MSSAGPKQRLFQQFATVAKSVAHPARLELLEAMAQGERSVEALADRAGLSLANASHHLQQMRRGGLVVGRRQGKYRLYQLADNAVLDLVGALTRIGEQNLAEAREVIRDYFVARDSLDPISRDELVTRMEEGSVTVLDVRPDDEYELGHLPGALNITVDRLSRRLRHFDKSQTIVAYCRGAYCVLSFEAVAELRKRGFDVRRLEDGYPEWKAAGLPIESGTAKP